jgi:membrane protein involved in colicin uptake
MSVPVANAEAVIRSQIHPGAKKCYQRGLESDPTQAGKIVILIKVAPSGEVDTATVQSNTGISASVAACISAVARRAKFDAPGPSGSQISVPFNFVKQGG